MVTLPEAQALPWALHGMLEAVLVVTTAVTALVVGTWRGIIRRVEIGI